MPPPPSPAGAGSGSPPPAAAVVGAGYLGQRIAAELILLGSTVAVHDTRLALTGAKRAQEALDMAVHQVLLECKEDELLESAGLAPLPKTPGTPWEPLPGQGARHARFCMSIAEAVADVDIVIEAVPDDLAIKREAFAQAVAAARPSTLLATSTLAIPLRSLRDAVVQTAEAKGCTSRAPRLIGLRFLSPVTFIPFVELTLTADQMQGDDFRDLAAILERWSKEAFHCDVEGVVDGASLEDDRSMALTRAVQRLRLDAGTAKRRQKAEARLRQVRRAGSLALAALRPADLFDFAEDTCCVCLEEPATVTSVLCGHCVLCAACSQIAARRHPRCPLCRTRFVASTAAGGPAPPGHVQEPRPGDP